MGRPMGKANKPNKKWTIEEKLDAVNRYLNDGVGFKNIAKEFETGHSTIRRWVHEYLDQGIAAFESKKTGNHFAALHTSKSLTEEERLKLIIAKQEIEIERLKKGYIVKGVGVNKEFVTLKDVNTR